MAPVHRRGARSASRLPAFIFTGHTSTYFAWTIVNPLAAAFLGGGYWASVSLEALAGRQPLWANARIAVPAVFVFTALTLVVTFMHLGQFHLGSRFGAGTQIVTMAWIAIYVLVPVLMLIILIVQARAPGADPPRRRACPPGYTPCSACRRLLCSASAWRCSPYRRTRHRYGPGN